MKISNLGLGCALVLLCGCTFFKSLESSPVTPLIEQAAVAAGVAAVVKGDPVRAAVVVSVAKGILAADTGSFASIQDLETALNAKIATLKLPPADAALAAALSAAVEAAIQDQIAVSTKGVSPTVQVAIATVAQWIITDAGG